jgi:hypothetical protein
VLVDRPTQLEAMQREVRAELVARRVSEILGMPITTTSTYQPYIEAPKPDNVEAWFASRKDEMEQAAQRIAQAGMPIAAKVAA